MTGWGNDEDRVSDTSLLHGDSLLHPTQRTDLTVEDVIKFRSRMQVL